MFKFTVIITFFVKLISCHVVKYDVWSVNDNALFPTLPIAAPFSDDENCKNDSRLFISSLKNKTYWAVKMWDSSTKTESGLLFGNTYNLGQFDECMSVQQPIQSQFCLVTIRLHFNISEINNKSFDLDPDPEVTVWKKFLNSRLDPTEFARDNITWSLCAPSSCSRNELLKSITRHLDNINAKNRIPKYVVHFDNDTPCITNKAIEYTAGEIAFWTSTAILILMVIGSSTIDFISVTKLKESRLNAALMSFSLKRNLKIFLKDENNAESKSLRILHFLQVISMFCIIFSHKLLFTFNLPLYNYQSFEEFKRTFLASISATGHVAIDSFFFISGMLAYYLLWENSKKVLQNPLLVIFRRWARLAFPYYFLVWFCAEASLRLGYGPVWEKIILPQSNHCKKNWWTNVLFLNNYINTEEPCLLCTWVVPCLFHLFIATTLLIIITVKHERIGVSLLGITTVISFIIPGITTYVYELNPFKAEDIQNIFLLTRLDLWRQFYASTHTRACAYLLGSIVAYIMIKTREMERKLPFIWEFSGYIFSIVLFIGPGSYLALTYEPVRPYSVVESALFAVFLHLSWNLGLVMIILVYRFGTPFRLKIFLEHRIWVSLNKLNYSIYIASPILQFGLLSRMRVPTYFSEIDVSLNGISEGILIVIFCFILYLIAELPFRNLFNVIIFANLKNGPITNAEKSVETCTERENVLTEYASRVV